ncbi:MAG: arginine--tRNA ligase [Gaiellaceae bacterium]
MPSPADPVTSLAEALGRGVELERPADPLHGDYATSAALRLAGARRQAPGALAAELVERAAARPDVERAEVAGPGFVNLFLRDAWFAGALAEILAAGESFGAGWAQQAQRIQVEMVSANPTGPISVAHARNAAYGDSVARLLELGGADVAREYYYNDAGAQMDKFRASVEAARRGEEPPEDGYRGGYIVELAATRGDPVPPMRAKIEETLERFRIHFDTWASQSELEKRVEELLPRLDTYEAEGTLWARTSAFGDDKDRPLIRSSDGSLLYYAADVAYVHDKFQRGFDVAIYVLGADHHGYVARLKAAAAMLGYDPARVEVLLYQLVQLVRGGEQTKMSKRRGDIVTLDELIDEIGVDAARWYLVNRGPDQTIEIDVDLAAEKSVKNPVYYVQYAHARIAGILRNAGDAPSSPAPAGAIAAEERELIKRLAELPAIAADAGEKRGPQAIPTYAIRVADDFHRFYHEHRVLESDEQAFRLALCRATQTVIARCLDLVGVAAPDRM